MSSTLGISTQATWTGTKTWPGLYHEISNVKFTTQYGNGKPGGSGTFSCDIICPDYAKPKGIAPGRILRVWRGAQNIWTGIINQPDTGGEGIGISADGIAKIMSSDRKFVNGVGFSNGCAALALKKPPPLVPSCLIASCDATGPSAMVCLAPSSVVVSAYGDRFWIAPCETRSSPNTMLRGRKT